MKLLFILILFISTNSFSNTLSVEYGQTVTNFNYFQLPNNDANRVKLPGDETINSARVTFWMNISESAKLYFLLAPLEVQYKFAPNANFVFNDQTYTQGTNTTVNYKFNSYRVGYLKEHKWSSFKLWYGGVLKMRDAFIEVKQGSQTDKFSNQGLVPLLSVGAQYFFTDSFSFFTHTDALGSSQGSAYDIQAELRVYGFGLGKRIVGGGADNDTLLNFAQFDTQYISYNFEF